MTTPRLSLAGAAGVLLAPLLATLPTPPAGRGRRGPGPGSGALGDPGRRDQPRRAQPHGADAARQARHAGAAPDDAARGLHPQRPHRVRDDGHPAQPHQHGHRPPDRCRRRRPRRDLERRPDDPATVQAAAGGPVASVFNVVHDAGRQTALFASKTKFSLWQRSWPLALDQYAVDLDNRRLTNAVRRDVRVNDRALTFVHLSNTDVVGHAQGWMTPAYLAAVRKADTYVGRILEAIDQAGETAETMVVVTADHGGQGRDHGDADGVRRLPDPLPGARARRPARRRPLRPEPRLPRPAPRPPDLRRDPAADPQRRGGQPGHRRAGPARRWPRARSTRARTWTSSAPRDPAGVGRRGLGPTGRGRASPDRRLDLHHAGARGTGRRPGRAPADDQGALAHPRRGADPPGGGHPAAAGRDRDAGPHVPGHGPHRRRRRRAGAPDVVAAGRAGARPRRRRVAGHPGGHAAYRPRARPGNRPAAHLPVVGARGEARGPRLGGRPGRVAGGLRDPGPARPGVRRHLPAPRLPPRQRAVDRVPHHGCRRLGRDVVGPGRARRGALRDVPRPPARAGGGLPVRGGVRRPRPRRAALLGRAGRGGLPARPDQGGDAVARRPAGT